MSAERVVASGNTVVPALLALEGLGFNVVVQDNSAGQKVVASRGDEEYSADDPVTVLGLVKLIEARGRNWMANDAEIESTLKKHQV